MVNPRQETLISLSTPEIVPRLETAEEYWSRESIEAVASKAASTPFVERTEVSSRAYIMDPEVNQDSIDSRLVGLSLPHLQGWTEHHYIRARVMQQLVAPNSRLVVFPHNALGQTNYDLRHLPKSALGQLDHGDMQPIGEFQMRTFEGIATEYRADEAALTGYSSGGRTVLAMANLGSDVINITHVNTDEMPSKKGRGTFGLQFDFLTSGIDVAGSIEDAGIPALSEAMNTRRRNEDFARFLIKNELTGDGWRMQRAMCGDVHDDIYDLAKKKQVFLKVGHIAGSKLFDLMSNLPRWETGWGQVDIVEYHGPGFRGHASADNPFVHAFMVNDGLNRSA